MKELASFRKNPRCHIYKVIGSKEVETSRLIATTADSRAITNDPFVLGVEYTSKLETACTDVLAALDPEKDLKIRESETAVLHILRGGLNFGLRQALSRAYGWNIHSSAFISAQRARRGDNPEQWYISENSYQKVYLDQRVSVIFGDVVATGTSLEFALNRLLEIILTSGGALRSVTFFTIGGIRSEEILLELDRRARATWPDYEGSTVIYLEGCFAVADPESQLTIKLTGTDLLRTRSLMAPEFIESQYENPSFPLERCTIYDAGSRAFHIAEYLKDVQEYWSQTLELSHKGMSFSDLLNERFPELDYSRYNKPILEQICRKQLDKVSRLLAQ